MDKMFSDRHGFGAKEPEITVREDAPESLRYAVAQVARTVGMSPVALRDIVCQVLLVTPDRNNWSEYPNIWEEVLSLLQECEWFRVYDIAEKIWVSFGMGYDRQIQFRNELNRVFREKGIGWEVKDYQGIVFRGGPTFTTTTHAAEYILQMTGRATAEAEIREALKDISRRPVPDRTGAIQHVIAAVECTARDVLNQPNATLGKLIPYLGLPKPLDAAVEKLWGFASDRARHLREGENVSDDEAELVVSIACGVCGFMAKRGKIVTP